MFSAKRKYLERLTPKFASKVEFGEHVEGASPPSVFIGKFGYPKVFVGPLLPPTHGDTTHMDRPEDWLSSQNHQKPLEVTDVINFRLQLARGMHAVKINDIHDNYVGKLREVALAKKSVEMQVDFTKKPRGSFFNEEVQPFGPSAPMKEMDFSNAKMQIDLEKAHDDTDLLAANAVNELYEKGVLVSTIQKAFSIGSFGKEKRRKLVPTRWSITAVDATIGKYLLNEITSNEVLDRFLLFEFYGFKNYFGVLMTPTTWKYEFLEVFLRIFGNEEMFFADHEGFDGRKTYAGMGGCYYSCRLAVVEKLREMQKQAGVVVFRESYTGYIPTGVWLVRESTRQALLSQPKEFASMNEALNYLSGKLMLPMWKYKYKGTLIKQISAQQPTASKIAA